MADFLLAFDYVVRGGGDENGTETSPECVQQIDHKLFHQYMLIPSSLLTLLLAFSIARKNLCLDCWWSRPGFIFPMDILGRSNRFSYAAAWGAISFLAADVVYNQLYAVDITGPIYIKAYAALLSMVIYGMDYFPLFASLAVESILGQIIGILYAWLFLGTVIYKTMECDYSGLTRAVLVLRNLPQLVCLGYLSISMPVRLVLSIRAKMSCFYSKERVSILDLKRAVKSSFTGAHVLELLKMPPHPPDPPTTVLGKVADIIKGFIHDWIYHPKAGFRYSSRLLSVMVIGLILIYKTTVELLVGFLPWFAIGLRYVEGALDAIGWVFPEGEDEEDAVITELRNTLYFLYYVVEATKICFIVAVSVTTTLGVLMILHMLSSYRSNLLAMYKGDHSTIPRATERSNASLLVGSMRYAGYQVGYIAWGYIIQFLILFLLSFGLAAFISLIKWRILDEWLFQRFMDIWPVLATTLIINLFQFLVAKFAFLQERGEFLSLNNRRVLFTFNYFMFFYNIFMGMVSCLLRILKSILIGTILLARLDHSALTRKFQFFDPGFAAYIGFMHVECAHTHPVLICFLRILLVELQLKQKEKASFQNGDISMGEKGLSQAKKRHCVSAHAKNRWFLAYTLMHNPSVRTQRKAYIQYVKEFRARLTKMLQANDSALGSLLNNTKKAATVVALEMTNAQLNVNNATDSDLMPTDVNLAVILNMQKFIAGLQNKLPEPPKAVENLKGKAKFVNMAKRAVYQQRSHDIVNNSRENTVDISIGNGLEEAAERSKEKTDAIPTSGSEPTESKFVLDICTEKTEDICNSNQEATDSVQNVYHTVVPVSIDIARDSNGTYF